MHAGRPLMHADRPMPLAGPFPPFPPLSWCPPAREAARP